MVVSSVVLPTLRAPVKTMIFFRVAAFFRLPAMARSIIKASLYSQYIKFFGLNRKNNIKISDIAEFFSFLFKTDRARLNKASGAIKSPRLRRRLVKTDLPGLFEFGERLLVLRV